MYLLREKVYFAMIFLVICHKLSEKSQLHQLCKPFTQHKRHAFDAMQRRHGGCFQNVSKYNYSITA